MTASEFLQKFEADFSKLKNSRQKIPLDQLKTKYAKAYAALVLDVKQGARHFTIEYLDALALPEHPRDTAGNEWVRRKIDTILQEEMKPGGLLPQASSALVDDLDYEAFMGKVYQLYERIKAEVWEPYQQRYNKWLTFNGKRVIWNSLFQAFWWPMDDALDGGEWVNTRLEVVQRLYPPRIGPDPEAPGTTQKSENQKGDQDHEH